MYFLPGQFDTFGVRNHTPYDLEVFRRRKIKHHQLQLEHYTKASEDELRRNPDNVIPLPEIAFTPCVGKCDLYYHIDSRKCVGCGQTETLSPIDVELPIEILVKILRYDRSLHYASRSLSKDIRLEVLPSIYEDELLKPIDEDEVPQTAYLVVHAQDYDCDQGGDHFKSISHVGSNRRHITEAEILHSTRIDRNTEIESDTKLCIGSWSRTHLFDVPEYYETELTFDIFTVERILRDRIVNIFHVDVNEALLYSVLQATLEGWSHNHLYPICNAFARGDKLGDITLITSDSIRDYVKQITVPFYSHSVGSSVRKSKPRN